MHGFKRIFVFCIVTTLLPAILIILPLYLRHSKFADVYYKVAESDILEIRDGISSVFCERHSLRMNTTFNAFQLNQKPTVSEIRKHIRLRKSMILPDDTLEYWGFYLLKGATVALKVCSRYDGSRILVVKGDKNLKTCGLMEHNKNKYGPNYAKELGTVIVTFETNAEEILNTTEQQPSPPPPEVMQQKGGGGGGSGGSANDDEDDDGLGMPFDVPKIVEERDDDDDDDDTVEAANTGAERLVALNQAPLVQKKFKSKETLQLRLIKKEELNNNNNNNSNQSNNSKKKKSEDVNGGGEVEDDPDAEQLKLDAEEYLKMHRNNGKAMEIIESALSKDDKEEEEDGGKSVSTSKKNPSKETKSEDDDDDESKKDYDDDDDDDDDDDTDESLLLTSFERKRWKKYVRQLSRRSARRFKRDLLLERKVNHGGSAINFTGDEASTSVSSFENSLLSCYDGQILLAQSFPPSTLCRNVKYLESGSHMVTTHEINSDGYYYYIFYSDNDNVKNDINALFDIHKPTFLYANISESSKCYNATNCSFPIQFLTDEVVIVEVPTRDGIEHEGDDFTVLISTCHPRMAVYVIFPITVLFLILSCAFL